MIISGLLAAASIIAILGLWNWATAPSWQTLLVGEEPSVVSDSITELETAGITYRVGAGGTMIEVPREQVADAEVQLASAGISSSTIVGYELLDNQGFSTSSFQQRINYQRALEGELTRTILDLDQVMAASVHLSIPEDELFSDEEEAPTASVVIDPGSSFSTRSVAGIVNVVAAAVPGMTADGVTVTDTAGRVLTDGGGTSSSDAFDSRRTLEQQLETSAQTMLIAAFGQENALVRVSAELNLDENERETVTYNPESQIALREQTITEQYAGGSDAASGIVGVTDEILDATTTADVDGTDYARNEQTSEFGVDRIRTVERNTGGQITRLSVAVVVNESLDPQPNLQQVSDVVAAAVGLDAERGDIIAVEAIAFDERFVEALETAATAEAPGDPLAPIAPYLGIAQTALAVLLLIIVALSLRKGVKTFTATIKAADAEVIDLDEEEAAALEEGSEDDESEDEDEEEDNEDGEMKSLEAGPRTTNDVMRIIDQQPIEVAALLRSWAAEGVES
jgi:flagellar M-ring protein FliF